MAGARSRMTAGTRALVFLIVALVAVALFYRDWLETHPDWVILFIVAYVTNNTVFSFAGMRHPSSGASFVRSDKWYQRAAQAGYRTALVRIAKLCERGDGCERDLAVAEKFYSRAAELGDADAIGWIANGHRRPATQKQGGRSGKEAP